MSKLYTLAAACGATNAYENSPKIGFDPDAWAKFEAALSPSGLPQPQTVAALREAATWLHAAYDRPPVTPDCAAMLERVDAALSAPAVETVAVQEAADPNLKAIIAHWNEFGPEHGFGQLMDRVQDAPPYRRASTPPEKDSHGNEPRNGAGDQSPEKDASPDAGRVGGTLRNGANEHHEHRAGQPDPDRADDQRHCEGVGLPRESEVREGVAAPLPVAPKAEPHECDACWRTVKDGRCPEGWCTLATPQADSAVAPKAEPVIINGEPATAHSMLAALIDIYDDAQNNPPEHRCYVESAWADMLKEARTFLASAPAVETVAVQEAAQVVAWLRDNTNEFGAAERIEARFAPLPVAPKAEPEWIDDPHDIEQGMMRNPKWKPAPQPVGADTLTDGDYGLLQSRFNRLQKKYDALAASPPRAIPAEQAAPTEPKAWLYTMHMEGGQTQTLVKLRQGNAFGIPGADYDHSYRVEETPLFATHPHEAAPTELDERRKCRDCADFGPTCPNTGEPCEGEAADRSAEAEEAARYRWLRDKSGIDDPIFLHVGSCQDDPGSIDEAIDAAMGTPAAAEPGKDGVA